MTATSGPSRAWYVRERTGGGVSYDRTTRSDRSFRPGFRVYSRIGPRVAKHEVMSIILFIVFGVIAGFLARAIMPGRQGMGIAMTAVLGIVGSFVGGFVGNLIAGRSVMEFHTSGIIGSVLGALAVLAIMGFAGRRSALA